LEEDAAQNVNTTMVGTILGTPTYMSPEQARGEVDRIGPSTDVYSLGVMLYELLTGTAPFTGRPVDVIAQLIERLPRSPRELRPEIPRDLAAICLKCLEKQPEDRYATAAELAGDLERFRAGLAISAHGPLAKESSRLWDRFRAFLPARKRPGSKGPGNA
jgi:serine/threonine protein kinase